MSIPTPVAEQYQARQRLTVATLALTRSAWSRMGQDFDASWGQVGPLVTVVTARAQLGAARLGAGYVGPTLDVIGTPVEPEAAVNTRAFAGVSSDGRPLGSLLEGAKVHAKQARLTGSDVTQALAAGGKWLDMAVHTQVADAARGAASVDIFTRPKVGWVRMVNPPCCSRCAILAGKWFRSNQGFQRHPRCDCTHVPSLEDDVGDVGTDPGALFRSGQVKGLSEAEAKAITDGADPAQVVNARRGSDGMFTTEGTTRRGVAGKLLIERGGGVRTRTGQVTRLTRTGPEQRTLFETRSRLRRPTPEAVYRYATSREGALNLLRVNGYLR